MDKELAKQLLDIVQGTKDFVITQVPDTFRELLLWQKVDTAFGVLIGLGWLLAAYLLSTQSIKFAKNHFKAAQEAGDICKTATLIGDDDYGIPLGIIHVFVCAFIIAGLCVLSSNFFQLLEIYLAPKVYLISYLHGVLK